MCFTKDSNAFICNKELVEQILNMYKRERTNTTDI